MLDKHPKITVTNIIATSSVEFMVNIEKFAELNSFVDIDVNYPVGAHCKNSDIVGLVTVFRSGKMISVGAKTIEQSRSNIQLITNLLIKQRKRIELKLK